MMSEADQKIQEFHQQFTKLTSDFKAHAVLQTEITVLQIKFSMEENLKSLGEQCFVVHCSLKLISLITEMKLDSTDMLYAPGSGYKPEKECLEGTRIDIINEISTWIHEPRSLTQVFWLNGLAGTGKSSIAHTVGKQFAEQGRLGSFFCFDISSKPAHGPQHLFSTMSLNLAGFDKNWGAALWNVIKDDRSLRTTDSVQRQFDEFLQKPANSLRVVGPVVIIIDALDECGDAMSRGALLLLLAKASAFPANFKVVITSRPDKDIVEAFQECSHIYCKDMDAIDEKKTNGDIFTYFQTKLSHQKSLDEKWPDQAWCHQLMKNAEGLFQWASTACLFINDPLEDPVSQLEMLLISTKSQGLDVLYHQILTKAIPMESKKTQLKVILGTLLVAKESLNVSVVSRLCLDISPTIVKKILQQLGSLFRGVSQDTVAIEPLHTSVRDFLMNEDQSHSFCINTAHAHKALVNVSLRIMKSLCFNICQIPTSYMKNEEINGIRQKVEQYIPAQLSYACQFWANHLEQVLFNEEIYLKVAEFTNSKILYWLEVLSLTNSLAAAIPSLQIVSIWLKVRVRIFTRSINLQTT